MRKRTNKPHKPEVPYAWHYLHPRYGIVVPANHRKLGDDTKYKLVGLHFYGKSMHVLVGYDHERRRFAVGDGTKLRGKLRAGWRWTEYWSHSSSLHKLRFKR